VQTTKSTEKQTHHFGVLETPNIKNYPDRFNYINRAAKKRVKYNLKRPGLHYGPEMSQGVRQTIKPLCISKKLTKTIVKGWIFQVFSEQIRLTNNAQTIDTSNHPSQRQVGVHSEWG